MAGDVVDLERHGLVLTALTDEDDEDEYDQYDEDL
jgi:hypothetical protein